MARSRGDTTTRSASLRLHVGDDGTMEDILRTHVAMSLATGYYCWKLRRMAKADGEGGEAARRILHEILLPPEDAGDGKAKPAKRKANASDIGGHYYKPFTDPASGAMGLVALRAGGSEIGRRIALLDRLAADPPLISDPDFRSLIMGRRPAWIAGAADGSLKPAEPWDEDKRKQMLLWIATQRKRLVGEPPLATMLRLGWLSPGSEWLSQPIERLVGAKAGANGKFRGGIIDLGKSAWSAACAHMATGARQVAERAAERRAKDAEIECEYKPLMGSAWWRQIDAYEAARGTSSGAVSGYRLGNGGELKGWGRIREAWLARRWDLKLPEPTAIDLRRICLTDQQRRPEEHGDAALFDWLGDPDRWALWDGREAPDPEDRGARGWDRVSTRADYSRRMRDLRGIGFAYPDPLAHPLGVKYADGGGTNALPWRGLRVDGTPRITMAFLHADADGGRCDMRDATLPCGMNRRLSTASDGTVLFEGQRAAMQQATLHLDRPILDRALHNAPAGVRALLDPKGAGPEAIEGIVRYLLPRYRDRLGRRPVHLHLALALPVPPRTSKDFLPLTKQHVVFNPKKGDVPFLPRHVLPKTLDVLAAAGLRILGVNLGMRVAAGTQAIRLGRADEIGPLPRRPILGRTDLAAILERRRAIRLDDEDGGRPDPYVVAGRELLSFARRMLARQSAVAKAIRDGSTQTDDDLLPEAPDGGEIAARLSEAPARAADPVRSAIAAVALARGTVGSALTAESLMALLRAYDALAVALHRLIRWYFAFPGSAGDDDERKPGRRGPSTARIVLLEARVAYERKHATRARPDLHPRRLSEGQRFMPDLQDRISRIKRDRCRKIADKIVKEALGGERDARDAPCHVIAMEDMNAYKAWAGRSRRENRRLMEWCHREILTLVVRKAQLHGITVAAVPSGHVSQFDGIDGSPGLRVERLTAAVAASRAWALVCEDRPELRAAQPGDLVPRDDGMEFVSLRGHEQADINAGGNVAFRFVSPPSALGPFRLGLTRQPDGTWAARSAGTLKGTRFKRQDDEATFVPIDGSSGSDFGSGRHTATIFRDPSGRVRGGAWTAAKAFWDEVRAKIVPMLLSERAA